MHPFFQGFLDASREVVGPLLWSAIFMLGANVAEAIDQSVLAASCSFGAGAAAGIAMLRGVRFLRKQRLLIKIVKQMDARTASARQARAAGDEWLARVHERALRRLCDEYDDVRDGHGP